MDTFTLISKEWKNVSMALISPFWFLQIFSILVSKNIGTKLRGSRGFPISRCLQTKAGCLQFNPDMDEMKFSLA